MLMPSKRLLLHDRTGVDRSRSYIGPHSLRVENHMFTLSQCLMKRGHKVLRDPPRAAAAAYRAGSAVVPTLTAARIELAFAAVAQVIVVTRSRGQRIGIRWLTNGLKVYYLPERCWQTLSHAWLPLEHCLPPLRLPQGRA